MRLHGHQADLHLFDWCFAGSHHELKAGEGWEDRHVLLTWLGRSLQGWSAWWPRQANFNASPLGILQWGHASSGVVAPFLLPALSGHTASSDAQEQELQILMHNQPLRLCWRV